jgi:[ribosomal protein S5]-alanine N-acetyltransferase
MIITSRLLLRPLTMEDVDGLQEIRGDPEAMRYYPQVYTREETEARVRRALESYARGISDFWAVTLKDTAEFVGVCGIKLQVVEGVEEREIGYLLVRRHWHHGYATEAAAAWRDYGFDVRHEPYLISLIRPINLPSQRVAERVGMTRTRTVMFEGLEHEVWRIERGMRAEG